MKHCYFPIITFLLILFSCKESSYKVPLEDKPNIIIIYLDDLGYGDVGCYGATAIKTPNIDYLAEHGIQFMNGYSTSATCTPSRYGLLTGVYPWKNDRAKILPGTAPLIIDTAQLTLPKMLKEKGYQTAVVGKWHLGLGAGNVNWNQHISPGPNEVGFDYSYIMAATQDRVPTVYIDNGEVVGLDPKDPIEIDYQHNFEGELTGLDNPELLKMMWHHGHNGSIVNGISRIGYMKGGKQARWIDEDMAGHFLEKAQEFVRQSKDKPFFLYYAMQQPHVPRTPQERFVGATDLGPRGDVIAEADWCIGELISTLEEQELLENTLIILTSDNGPVLNDGYYDDAVERNGDHDPFGKLRGGKYSLYEAGTRVPFISYWKGKIQPKKSEAIVSQLDLLASLADLVGEKVGEVDSENYLPILLGSSAKGRESLIIEASSRTALRKGDYVLIPPYDGPAIYKDVNIEVGNSPIFQLFNLELDPGQNENRAKLDSVKLQELIKEYKAIRGEEEKAIEPVVLH